MSAAGFGNFWADWKTYPPAAEILAQTVGEIPAWVADSFKKREKRSLCEVFEDHSRQLQQDVERYEDVRVRGVEALSRYDVEICAQGDGDAATRTAISLKYNHISYHRLHLEYIRQRWPGVVPFAEKHLQQEQQALAIKEAAGVQLSLF